MSGAAIRVAIAGGYGKTGSVVHEALERASGIEVVARLVKNGKGKAATDHVDIAELHKTAKPDVLVDFTIFPDSKAIALAAIETRIRPVIGTTGYQPADVAEVQQACARTGIGGIIASNFAPGAVLMMHFAEAAARFFDSVEIIESHHAGKKDAPSGTALATAERLAQLKTFRRPEAQLVKAPGARGADVHGVGVHSIRLPGIIAGQEIQFANDDEMLVIRQVALSRKAFVPGVIHAIHAVMGLQRLVVGMEELLV